MRILTGLFLAVIGSAVSMAQPSVSQTETLDIHHYEVTGLSPEHLINSFRARTNPAVMATTLGGVDVRYDFAFGGDECRLMQVELKLDIDITYPLWREEARGPDAMRTEWARFMIAVRAHEQGHVDRFRRAANEMSDRLAAIPPASSCRTVRSAVAAERERFRHEIAIIQAEYERQTDNGANQGARLRFR